MKKHLIILAFLPLFGFGQKTAGYDFLYDGDIVVVGSDTTLEGNTDYILTFVDFDITLDYLPLKSKVRLNDQPLCTFFQNANYADTSFALIAEHTLNADLTEDLPSRITEIWHYTTPTPDVNNYAETPPKATVDFIDVTTTIQAAINAASAGDTIYIPSGVYNEGNYLSVNKDNIYIQGIGAVTITSSGETSYNVFFFNDTKAFNNITIDGLNSDQRGLTINSKKVSVNNCAIVNHTFYHIFRNGTNSQINNSIFYSTSINTAFSFNSYPYSSSMNECLIYGNSTNELFYKFNTNDTSKLSVTYCDFELKQTDEIYIGSSNLDFNYNNILADTSTVKMIKFLSSTADKTHLIKGNSFDINGYSEGFGLLNIGLDNYDFNINNNTLLTNGGGGLNFNFIQCTSGTDNSFSITDNFFDIKNGNAIYIDNIDAGNSIDISNNRIYSRTATTNDSWFTVRIDNLPDDIEPIFSGNVIRNPISFGSIFGGHACLFVNNTINATFKNDSLFGAGLGAIIYKNDGGENTDALIQGNVVDNILIKGQRKVNIYNNTFNGSDYYGLRIMENQDVGAVDKRADSCEVYNNIFNDCDTALFISNENGLAANTMSDNNMFFGFNSFMVYSGTQQTFSWWQTNFSQDLNSFNTDPLLSAALCPASNSPAVFAGLNLGSPYNQGLVCGTSFPNPTLRNQTTQFFTIGAYVVDKPINSVVRIIGGGMWIYNNSIVGY